MTEPVPEFSRIIASDRIPPAGIEERLEAKPAEREALAKRFGLLGLPQLKAQLTLTPERQMIAAAGTITADIVQSCVVTLEPLKTHLELDVATVFIPAAAQDRGAGSPYAEDGDEEFEVFSGGKIDLGEMVAQHLGVNIDPYPRQPDAALPATTFGPEEQKIRPFAGLAELSKKQGETDG